MQISCSKKKESDPKGGPTRKKHWHDCCVTMHAIGLLPRQPLPWCSSDLINLEGLP